MPRSRELWLLVPGPVRRLPVDLALVVAGTVLTNVTVLAPVVRETPLRVVLGLPFVLFLPGYAFIAALFPEAGEAPTATDNAEEEGTDSRLVDRGIDGIERVALSFGLSIAIVPLIGLVLNFTPWGIRLGPILLSVSGFTLIAVVVAQYRRERLPPEERFHVPFAAWIDTAVTEITEPADRTDAALNVLLAVSVILAVASVGYAVAVPPQGERFTEFYILTEDEDNELVAAEYATEFVVGESDSLVLGISNQEHREVEYTVLIELQRVEHVNNTTTRVLERSELQRFDVTLAHNETELRNLTITPDLAGEGLRLQFLLFDESQPVVSDREAAYRDLHLWINVTEQ